MMEGGGGAESIAGKAARETEGGGMERMAGGNARDVRFKCMDLLLQGVVCRYQLS